MSFPHHNPRLAVVGIGSCLMARALMASVLVGELGRSGCRIIEPPSPPPVPEDKLFLAAARDMEMARLAKEDFRATGTLNQPFYMGLPKYQRRARRERHRR